MMNKIDHIKLSKDATIKDAISVIEHGGIGMAFSVDDNEVLLGILTDGDIRRAIIGGSTLEDKIEFILNKNPLVCSLEDTRETIVNLAIEKKLYQIPIVDSVGRIVGIEELGKLLTIPKFSNKIVLMVGGLGSRLRPLTNDVPKPMLKIGDKPILERIITDFVKHGFKNFILSVNYKAEMIVDYFGDGSKFGAFIEYVHEDKRMGTAGSLSFMKEKLSEPFFVMNGDILTEANFRVMMEYHEKHDPIATMGLREYDIQIPYGVINADKSSNIINIEEKPVMTFFVNGGIYIINPKALDYIVNEDFLDMPTLFETLISNEEKVMSYAIREYWLDIGSSGDFELAQQKYE